MSTLFENYTSTNTPYDAEIGISTWGDIYWATQTFTPTVSHSITSVNLLLSGLALAGYPPGTITVGIRVTSSGLPTGGDITSGTTNGNTLGLTYEWRAITLTSYALTMGTVYAIVCRCTGTGSEGALPLHWSGDSAGTYSGGTFVLSIDNGVTWAANVATDLHFQEWGDAVAVVKRGIWIEGTAFKYFDSTGTERSIVGDLV